MDIFYLSNDPDGAARMQCDKHVVKLIVETAQILSTAHRVLDGVHEILISKHGRRKQYWRMQDDSLESVLYKPTHVNHPSCVWARAALLNYTWLFKHFEALLDEYTYRYGKTHATSRLLNVLSKSPDNIPPGTTIIPLCMKSAPECMNMSNPVESYRNFYKTKASRFKMVWTKRPTPHWWNN